MERCPAVWGTHPSDARKNLRKLGRPREIAAYGGLKDIEDQPSLGHQLGYFSFAGETSQNVNGVAMGIAGIQERWVAVEKLRNGLDIACGYGIAKRFGVKQLWGGGRGWGKSCRSGRGAEEKGASGFVHGATLRYRGASGKTGRINFSLVATSHRINRFQP
jgi:hypothetical protein